MKVLFAASEAVPFIKSGGLADVVGSLPKELNRLGLDVRVILPKYKDIPERLRVLLEPVGSTTVEMNWRQQYCGVLTMEYEGIRFYFIDNEYYFRRDGLYGYFDEAERFAFFCRGVLAALPLIDFRPDIMHLHDWQTAMISVLLAAHYGSGEFYRDMHTVLTIHNLKYQGVFPKSVLGDLLDIGWNFFHPNGLEYHDNVNFLKGGIAYADKLTTVSPTYAQEIQLPFFGENLDGMLRKRTDDLKGILNGLDYDLYNPGSDPHIECTYNARTVTRGKAANKAALQQRLGLTQEPAAPLIAVISRLVGQKGLDLITHVFDEITADGVQFAILGSGEGQYERFFRERAQRLPHQVAAVIGFDEPLAHQLYAGADMFLMPSLFEPCGLSQLMALRYGCVPLVRETGGLRDTVQPYNSETGQGTGFTFANYNAHDMLFTVRRAVDFFGDKALWRRLCQRGMKMDFSWGNSARQYEELYRSLPGLGDL